MKNLLVAFGTISKIPVPTVKKINIKGVNNITISPGSIGKLIHTLEVKTPGSVDLSAVSSKGYSITIYKIDSDGNIIEEWNFSDKLDNPEET